MRRLDSGLNSPAEISFELDGETVLAREGDTVASAMLAQGERVFSRSVKYHRPRGPFCLTGTCTHCLMRVDGAPNVYTCRTRVRSGMQVERQNAYPSVEHDLFASIDWFFPKGMDHHAMFAGVPVAEAVMAKVARQLAGLGLLPEKSAPARLDAEVLRRPVIIVGGGPAGLGAARVLRDAGAPFLLLEARPVLGGRLLTGAPGSGDPSPAEFGTFGDEVVRTGTVVIGCFRDEAGTYLAAVQEGRGHGEARLLKLYAERVLFATGGYASVLPFANNDFPGVMAGRALSQLVRVHRVLPGQKVALVGRGEELYRLAHLLAEKGAQLAAVVDIESTPPQGAPAIAVRGEPLAAHGRHGVKAFSFKAAGERKVRKVRCEVVGVSLPPSPAFELVSQGGAQVVFSPELQCFVVEADEDGRTAAPHLFAAGEVRGPCSASESARAGARAAQAMLSSSTSSSSSSSSGSSASAPEVER
jgi:sarcosine oxidase, subunit alpha